VDAFKGQRAASVFFRYLSVFPGPSRRSVVDNVSAEHLTFICGNIFLISHNKRGLNKSRLLFYGHLKVLR